jgi:hypothetical protein
MLTIPPWALWMMMAASALGTLLLLLQLRALNWRVT